jgi:hypothetical protein
VTSAPVHGEAAGRYVEARTASVFAGACHYNSEYVTAGREAVLAWRFDADGQGLVAAVASSANLAEQKPRKSVIYVDRAMSAPARDEAVAWVRVYHADVLGDVIAVEVCDVDVSFEGERYSVRAGDRIRIEGAMLPDRACCSMPSDVWYEPMSKVDGRVVGNSSRFEWNETRLAPKFTRSGHNDAFVGSFVAAPAVQHAKLEALAE